MPDVRGLIVGGHANEPDLGRLQTLARQLGISDRVTFTGLVEPARVAGAAAGRERAGAAEPGIGDLDAVHVAAEAVRVPGGRPRRSSPRTCRRSARFCTTTSMRCSSRRRRARAGRRDPATARRSGACARGWRAPRSTPRRSTPGNAARERLEALFDRGDTRHRDFAGSPVPRAVSGLPWRARRAAGRRWCCRGCGRAYHSLVGRLSRPASARRVRRADEIPRRVAARRRASRARVAAAARIEDSQRHAAGLPRARARRPRRRSGLRQRPHAAVEPRLGRAGGRHRHQPVFLGRGAARDRSAASAICAGCRSPTARSRRRSRSTCSSISRRRRCAACSPRPRACWRPAARCSSTRTCGRTRRIAVGLRGSTRSRGGSSDRGSIDLRQERLRKSDHLNPLRDIPELEQVARAAGFRIAPHPLLHTARRRVRREHPDAPGRARDGAPGAARGSPDRSAPPRPTRGDPRGAHHRQGPHRQQPPRPMRLFAGCRSR